MTDEEKLTWIQMNLTILEKIIQFRGQLANHVQDIVQKVEQKALNNIECLL